MQQYAIALLLFAGAAQAATIDISLDQPLPTGAPGSELTFTGTVANTSASAVFLNSAGINLAGFDPADEDTSPFFINAPLSLDALASTASIGLFTVDIPLPFATGPYQGTFTILGGAVGDAQDTLGSASFTVQVQSATTVPEPASALLVAIGLAALRERRGRTRRVSS